MRRKSLLIMAVGAVLLLARAANLLAGSHATALAEGMQTGTIVVLLVAAFVVFVLFGARHVVRRDPGSSTIERGTGGDTLVVLLRGLGGRQGIRELHGLVRQQYPEADLLTSTVEPSPLANIDPYRVANVMEHAIHDAYEKTKYRRIILIGYSLGALVLRKAWVWGNGIEDDRLRLGGHGKRAWVDRVERFVSLAGINRGWSIDPKPPSMPFRRYFLYYFTERIARLAGIGGMLLATQRGAPFVADLRVQWIRLVRELDAAPDKKPPFVIHLLGDIDDIVAMEDSQDIAAAAGTSFVWLLNTNHESILDVSGSDPRNLQRRQVILDALASPPEKLSIEKPQPRTQQHDVRRVVFVYHGIRDFGVWTNRIKDAVTERAPPAQTGIAVSTPKYGFFPMLAFLLYWDRQKNVRKFMDEYTETLARYPALDAVDYVGHSNGTYLLASALQHYKTVRVRNVLFAGSVVPRFFDWISLIDSGRVVKVRNIVASGDWVVAWFPRFFEQIADWFSWTPTTGPLDIGSGGFRGFDDAGHPDGAVRNMQFVAGGHGAGVDIAIAERLEAIVDYIATDDETKLDDAFTRCKQPNRAIDVFSNVSWLIWLLLAGALLAIGYWLSTFGVSFVLIYAGLVILLLASV